MKNNSAGNDSWYSRKETGHENSQNYTGLAMEVHVDDVKSWKDHHEHENIRRQRQDLFDIWEQGKKTSITK